MRSGIGNARGGAKLKIPSRWAPGSHIVWRGNLWFALPMTVVQDSPDLIALYWPAGTCGKAPDKRPTPQDLMSLEKVVLVDYVWKETDVLMLAMPGAAHSVYVMWDAGHIRFRCWYVNLEEPLRRTPLGFDTMDHLLDIVIRPNGIEWRWKDEDEFRQAEAIGLYSGEEARDSRGGRTSPRSAESGPFAILRSVGEMVTVGGLENPHATCELGRPRCQPVSIKTEQERRRPICPAHWLMLKFPRRLLTIYPPHLF